MSYTYAEVAAPSGAPLLFLFHGTGGDENDLLDLGRAVMPGAHLISPRGDVSEGGALRFFRRTGEGVFDMADFSRATDKMAAFVGERIAALKPSSVAGLGYSNGANILAAILFAAAPVGRAVLMHPLIPFAPPLLTTSPRVLVTAGRRDPIAPVALTARLATHFGAQLAWHEGGHELRAAEVEAARDFLGAQP
jgi:phospholipase/carboxylesterase